MLSSYSFSNQPSGINTSVCTVGHLMKGIYYNQQDKQIHYCQQQGMQTVELDPAVTSGSASDETGIVVAGIASDGHIYVLADHSLKGTPAEWGSRVVNAYHEHQADRVVAEVNNGGEIIESMLRNIDRDIPYEAVRASRGKALRAEPVAALYEQGRVHHVGRFPHLEEQMCNWLPGEKSPDRMDALVWAIAHLTEQPIDSGIVVPFMSTGSVRYPDKYTHGRSAPQRLEMPSSWRALYGR